MNRDTRRVQLAVMALELAAEYLPARLKLPIAIMLSEIFEDWDDGRTLEAGISTGERRTVGALSSLWSDTLSERSAATPPGEGAEVGVLGVREGWGPAESRRLSDGTFVDEGS